MKSLSLVIFALVLASLLASNGPSALAAARIRNDPRLFAALLADRELQACRCLRAASWLDESYPRITVDAKRWNALPLAARTRFGARALRHVQAVYLEEWGTTHFYQQVFVVDPSGRQLFAYAP
jgi:hypothetical protein